MKKQLGIICVAIAIFGAQTIIAAPKKTTSKKVANKKKRTVNSEFNWQWPDTREQAVNRCNKYLAFMKPKMKSLSGEARAHFKLHLDIAEALLQHLRAIQKKHGFRMDAKRCRSELIRAERILNYNKKKSEKVKVVT